MLNSTTLTIKKLINNPQAKEIYKDFTFDENFEMIQKIYQSKVFQKDLDDSKIYNLVDYAYHLPKELLLVMWGVVCDNHSTQQNIIHWSVADIPSLGENTQITEFIASAVTESPEIIDVANKLLEEIEK